MITDIVKKHKYLFITIGVYIVVRLLLININYTEWGDGFRYIRGAEYLSRFTWAWDEKRLPFYPLLLIPGIWTNSPVIWGRILALIISVLTIFTVYIFYLKHISNNKFYALFASVFLITTPVYSYWSPRIMADVLFALLVILSFYLFLSYYKDQQNNFVVSGKYNIGIIYLLSITLLMVTMTRFEGVFAAFGIGLYMLYRKKMKDIFIVYIPQILIFFPWILYTKFLYQGEVQQNDYFDEIQTFVFNLDRLIYFSVYTVFLFVIPFIVFFIIYGGIRFTQKKGFQNIEPYIPIAIFIGCELLIGYIWTPSLPRIYVPILSFGAILFAFGLQKFEFGKWKWLLITLFSISIGAFIIIQYQMKLYFLGASKLAMLSVVLLSVSMVVLMAFKNNWKKPVVIACILLNLSVSFVVVVNERLAYKTIKQGLDYITNEIDVREPDMVAYSDETGNSTWYLRDVGIRPEFDKDLSFDSQYKYLLENNIDYLIWTNEFNRGSYFKDPEEDEDNLDRYTLLAKYEEPAVGIFARVLEKFDLTTFDGYYFFETKVYKINEENTK